MTRPLLVLASPARQGRDGNPYVAQLNDGLRDQGLEVLPVRRRALLGRVDIVHVHWPEALVRWEKPGPVVALDVAKVLTALWVSRRRGARLVWTGHNLGPHEPRRPWLSHVFMTGFGAMTDLVLTLSPSGADALRMRYRWMRRKQVEVIPHGHYRDAYDAPPTRSSARRILGLPTDLPVFLLMGQVRPYKGIPALVSAFQAGYSDRAVLLVAGSADADPGLGVELTELTRDSPSVMLRLGVVPSDEVPVLHAAADVVVLPYTSGSTLNSGAAILGLSLDRPVVVPASGGMQDLDAAAGAGWVHLFQGSPTEALESAMTAVGSSRSNRPDLSTMEWPRIAAATADAFRSLAGQRDRRRARQRARGFSGIT